MTLIGNRTYILVGAFAVLVVIAYIQGDLTLIEAARSLVGGGAIATLRAAKVA